MSGLLNSAMEKLNLANLNLAEFNALKYYFVKLTLFDLSRLSVPADRRFTKHLQDCNNIKAPDNACTNLAGMQAVICKAYKIIKREINYYNSYHSDGAYIKVPLILCRTAKGGKSTSLRVLFDRLKSESDYNVMIISFDENSGFRRQDCESQSNAILRCIASQLIDCTEDEALNICCDKDALDAYIAATLPTRGFVLLVDELSALGPLDSDAKRLLRELFVNPEGRYIVITSQVPMTLDEYRSHELGASQGLRGPTIIPLSYTLNIHDLRSMSKACEALTPLQALWLGGIPSLIYSTYVTKELTLEQLFNMHPFPQSTDYKSHLNLFSHFTLEFICGRRHMGGTDVFDKYTSIPCQNNYIWSLCYAAYIVKGFATTLSHLSPLIQCFNEIEAMVNSEKCQNYDQSNSDLGQENWQKKIIEIAILFRCYNNIHHCNCLPFRMSGTMDDALRGTNRLVTYSRAETVLYLHIPSHITSIDTAYEFINSHNSIAHIDTPTIALFTIDYTDFLMFDGFLVFSYRTPSSTGHNSDEKLSSYTVIAGYKVTTASTATEVSTYTVVPIPKWVNGGGWLLQMHNEPITDTTTTLAEYRYSLHNEADKNGWLKMNHKQVSEDILGFSLAEYDTSDDWPPNYYNKAD